MTRRLEIVARITAATVLAEIILSPGLWGIGDTWVAPLPVVAVPEPLLFAATVAVAAAAGVVVAGWRLPRTLPLFAAVLLLRCAPDRALWQSYLLEQTLVTLVAAWALRAPAARAAWSAGSPGRWEPAARAAWSAGSPGRWEPAARAAWSAGSPGRWEPAARAGDALVALRLMLALLFVWAGLHKLNPAFVENGLGAILAPLGIASTPAWVNVGAALLESLLGAALLVPRARRAASFALAAFSLAVAAALLVLGTNRAVIPWNLAHALLLPLLFARDDRPSFALRPVPVAVALLFGLVPALHPLGVPPYLALRLYTGSSLDAVLYLDDVGALPGPARAVAAPDSSGTFAGAVPIIVWAHEATGAFVPPDDPVFDAVTSRVCDRVPHPDRVLAVVSAPLDWSGQARDTRYLRCPDRTQ